MSISFERSRGASIQNISVHDSSESKEFSGDRRLELDSDLSSSSSIGKNSDLSGRSSDGNVYDEDEVQSSWKGPSDTMGALDEVFPDKKGISMFYSGKSKSFTNLAKASAISSMNELIKPEDPYTKKRKNLLARTLKKGSGEMLKRPTSYFQSMFHLGETLSSSSGKDNGEDYSSSNLLEPGYSRPPLHPKVKRSSCISSSSPTEPNSPWRSFSLSDLRSVVASTK